MSGTDEQQTTQAGSEGSNNNAVNQSGTDNTAEQIAALKAEIADLRKEAANYRTKAKDTAKGKETVEEQLKALQDEFAKTKRENRIVKNQSLLDKAGCIKSDLVATAIPDDCDDVQKWIEDYKKDNEVLFKAATNNHGGNYKPSTSNNVNPHDAMNNFIRTQSGRK